MTNVDERPWYRHRWPWLLMSGPAIVVVAGTYTAALAIRTNDPLVADDYYKQGLGINVAIARDERAATLRVQAEALFNPERDRVRVTLTPASVAPATLRLALFHGARADDDRAVVLDRIGPGVYEGALRAPPAGLWQLRLEDGEGTWRITGDWKTRQSGTTLGTAP